MVIERLKNWIRSHSASTPKGDIPRNSIEFMLKEAAQDPARRAKFFRALPDSEVYVLGTTRGMGVADDDGSIRSTGDLQLELAYFNRDSDGALFIPAYSSLDRLQEAFRKEGQFQGDVSNQGNLSYLKIKFSSLVEVAPDEASIHINAGSGLGVFLSAEDAGRVVRGEAGPRERTLHPGEQLTLVAPEETYQPLSKTIAQVLKNRGTFVSEAYLAIRVGSDNGPKRRPVLGIAAPGASEPQFREWVDEISVAVQSKLSDGAELDVLRLDDSPKMLSAMKRVGLRVAATK